MASVNNWLLLGTEDGWIHVVDLHTTQSLCRWKHGNSPHLDYKGISALHVIPSTCTNQREYLAITGCSEGILKFWTLPSTNASASSLHSNKATIDNDHGYKSNSSYSYQMSSYMNALYQSSFSSRSSTTTTTTSHKTNGYSSSFITSSSSSSSSNGNHDSQQTIEQTIKRLKNTSGQMVKLHKQPITCIVGELHLHHPSTTMGWIVAAGDRAGQCSVMRPRDTSLNDQGNSNSTNTTSSSLDIISMKMQDAFLHYRSSNPQRTSSNGNNQHRVSSLAFIPMGFVATNHNPVMDVVKQYATTKSSSAHSTNQQHPQQPHLHHHVDPLLAMGSHLGAVAVFDILSGQTIFSVEGHTNQIIKLLPIKPNVFLSASYDRSMKLWDIRMKSVIQALKSTTTNTPPMASTHHSTNTNNTSTHQGLMKAYEERLLGSYAPMKRCASAALTEVVVGGWENSLIISGSAHGELRLWDLRYDLHHPCTTIAAAHDDRITSIVWNSPEEFYTTSFDGSIAGWDSIHACNTHRLKLFSYPILSMTPAATATNAASTGTSVNAASSNTTTNRTTINEGILQMNMVDFYQRIPSTCNALMANPPHSLKGGSNSISSSGAAVTTSMASAGHILLHRQCIIAHGWYGNLKVYAKDHFIQSESEQH
jgi:WD40 repeat protein